MIRLMDEILHYPLEGIYHNSHSLGSLGSCRILSISRMEKRDSASVNAMVGIRRPSTGGTSGLGLRVEGLWPL